MKYKVKFSGYVWLLTILVAGALLAGSYIFFRQGQRPGGFLMLAFLMVLVVLSCIYAPMAIIVDSEYLKVRSVLRTWKLYLHEIESIEMFQPTIGAMRICASGGYMGYWGLYREEDVGNYIAFYGRSSDCFMIRLKNGDKYVLGCKKPRLIVDEIKTKIISN